MIELKDLIFKIKKQNSPEYNRLFSPGVNHIDYTDKNLFNFLTINNQEYVSGQFLVDGVSGFDNESNNSFVVLKINSFCFSLFAIFFVPNNDKTDKIKALNEEISPLKDINSPKQKINCLLEILKKWNVTYICLDFTNDINSEYSLLINETISSYPSLTFIVLDIDNSVSSYYSIDLSSTPVVQSDSLDQHNKPKSKKTVKIKQEISQTNSEKSFVNFSILNKKSRVPFIRFLFDNIALFLFLILPITGFVGPFLLSSTYFVDGNVGFGITFLITGLFCLIIHTINLCDIYDFIDIKNDLYKKKHLYTFFACLFSLILGVAGGIGFFFLIKHISPLKNPDNVNLFISIAPALIMAIVVAAAPIYIRYVRTFINKIKLIFKKKEN